MSTVDILLATYNGERFIQEQIDSLLRQTFNDFKIIVCDDNSKDATLKIINNMIIKNSDKISLVIKPEIIPQGAMNTFSYLLGQSNSRYIMFCDQDDVWMDNKIEIMLEEMRKQEEVFGENSQILINSDLQIVDAGLGLISQSFIGSQKIIANSDFSNILIKNPVTGCACMFNRPMLMQMAVIPKQAIMHDWWLALHVSAFGKMVFVDKSLTKYRQHGNNVLGAKKRGIINIIKQTKKISHSLYNKKSPLDKYIDQAKEFKLIYGEMIPDNINSQLNKFIYLFENKNFCKRVYYFVKLKITKSSLFDDLILVLLVALRRPK